MTYVPTPKTIALVLARVAASFLIACIAAYITFFAHGRVSAALSGVPLRELSEDYGGAFQAVLFSIFVFLIVFAFGIWAMGKVINMFNQR